MKEIENDSNINISSTSNNLNDLSVTNISKPMPHKNEDIKELENKINKAQSISDLKKYKIVK